MRLPPSEAAFKQHMLRVSFQVHVWINAGLAKPPPRSPFEYGWEKSGNVLKPIFFEGQMSSDFLNDLICNCRGKNMCSKTCVCFEQNLGCTSVCICQASDDCRNAHTQKVNTEDIEDD